MAADSLRRRLGQAVALHERMSWPSAGQSCRCGKWSVKVPYNASLAASAFDRHRTDALVAVVADWLRAKADDTRACADLGTVIEELEAHAAAKMLDALARSITESTDGGD